MRFLDTYGAASLPQDDAGRGFMPGIKISRYSKNFG
jgi:hypothetical protein